MRRRSARGRRSTSIEIDAASNRGIDAVRDLRERLPYPPGELRRKVYILDEAHQITRDAWNALLKSLEEPPDFVVFMFASTEPSGFPPAILSRLQRFDVRRLTVAEIEGKLARILAADGRDADPAAIHLIAKLAAGGMRDAESMLDQLLSAAPDRIDEEHVRELLGLADAEAVDALHRPSRPRRRRAPALRSSRPRRRGRDVRALLDQAVDAIRAELSRARQDPAAARHDPAALAAVGRRLAAIDPNRAGIGGLRFQLELAMFDGPGVRPVANSPAAPKPSATSQQTSRGRCLGRDTEGNRSPSTENARRSRTARGHARAESTTRPTPVSADPAVQLCTARRVDPAGQAGGAAVRPGVPGPRRCRRERGTSDPRP